MQLRDKDCRCPLCRDRRERTRRRCLTAACILRKNNVSHDMIHYILTGDHDNCYPLFDFTPCVFPCPHLLNIAKLIRCVKRFKTKFNDCEVVFLHNQPEFEYGVRNPKWEWNWKYTPGTSIFRLILNYT